MTTTQILTRAMKLDPMPQPPEELFDTRYCAITGEAITRGYPAMKIVPSAASDLLGIFNGNPYGYVSETAALMLNSDWNLGSRIAFADTTHFHLLANREAAEKQGRPYWSKTVRDIWPERRGQECVMILTTDFKKRSWPFARAGVLGAVTPVYVHASEYNLSANVVVNWPALLSVLDVLENAYSAGFSKESIRQCVMTQTSRTQTLGFAVAAAIERQLKPVRNLPEFIPALIMAQQYPELVAKYPPQKTKKSKPGDSK